MSTGENQEPYQHVQLKDAEILKKMMASQKLELKLHQQKEKLELMLKLRLHDGEELTVPAEDGVVEYRRQFEVGKHHHLGFLYDQRTNLCKMAEVDCDPEVFLLDVKHLFVDSVKVVTGVRAVRLNFEFVQDYQVHSVEKTLDSSQLLLQPTLFESSELNLLQKVAFV